MSLVIGVPTASSIAAVAAVKTNTNTLEMLQNLQKLVDEFKTKLTEMNEEMQTVKLENSLLKNKISERTSIKASPSQSQSQSQSPSRRGLFGYGADEF
jgi:regulator of replication initiation timing